MAYARWGPTQRAHAAAEPDQLGPVPRAGFWQGVDDAARLPLLHGLRDVRCPVLVLTGDRDAISGMRAGEAAAASFPHARVRPLHEVGHYPWVDEPDLFRLLIEEFLRS
ncbi:alpha/beta fold hydrolase [Streptomyces triculaminicus]|uniref:alpha/beta fold hydrolase n=1 Tax=Streptomyces triculaminicus TaxID=2816232 RepID=UPI0037D1A164